MSLYLFYIYMYLVPRPFTVFKGGYIYSWIEAKVNAVSWYILRHMVCGKPNLSPEELLSWVKIVVEDQQVFFGGDKNLHFW